VASPSPSGITLRFVLAPGRRLDVDNLARPALAALQDAGWFKRGFVGFDRIVVTKTFGDEGLLVAVSPGFEVSPPPSSSTVTVRHDAIPASDRREALRVWFDAVASHCHRAVVGPVAVEVEAGTTLSLVGIMKPIIDGLEPVLGRDPASTSEFAPLDDRAMRLVMQRTTNGSGLVARIRPGFMEAG
jgi:hypothetical protein